jgi:fructose-bisphosphate aldolase, class I
VPIVEPEVLMDGDHDIDRCAKVTELGAEGILPAALLCQRVALEGMVLKPNMIVPGKKSPKQASVEEVAEKTVRVLKLRAGGGAGHRLPVGRPVRRGSHRASRRHQRDRRLPWPVTFSYGRALQPRRKRRGRARPRTSPRRRRAFAHRALMNSLAATGKWTKADEKKAA